MPSSCVHTSIFKNFYFTFPEAIEKYSRSIEDVLEIMKKGTLFWKVRSYSKWYRKKYFLDPRGGCLIYTDSRRGFCMKTIKESKI